MEYDFIRYIEKEVKNYKLYKIQEIEDAKRKYEVILSMIKEPRLVVISKNIWLILLIIIISIIGVLSLIFVFYPTFPLELIENQGLHINNSEKIIFSLFFAIMFIFSSLVLYLFNDKIHKNNFIYKMNNLTSESIDLLEKINREEKVKYETLVDYIVLNNKLV